MIKPKIMNKLREFRQGMDLEKFMSGEFRQNMQSIQNFLDGSAKLIYDPIMILGNFTQTVTNATAFFNISTSLIRSGMVKDHFYYPAQAGTYWVEANAAFSNSGTANGTASLQVVSSDTQAAYSAGAQSNYSISGGVVNNYPTSLGFFADLSPNIGLGFIGASSNSSLIISNLNFKITKVG